MRRTTITTITYEQITIGLLPTTAPKSWCTDCAARVVWLTPEQAAMAAGCDTRQVYRWIESGALHFTEAEPEAPRLCLPALLRQAQRQSAECRGCLSEPADEA